MYLVYPMKGISGFVLVMLAVSGAIDLAGFAFGLFYEGVFYDNLAHFLTTFALVALAAELYLRHDSARERPAPALTARQTLVAGAALALVGGAVWEGFEALLNLAFPQTIYNPPVDSVVDTIFGVAGGALGAWRTAASSGLLLSTGYLSRPREKAE